jgi:phospholipid/cholesterol/gamma-HCH transport system substrate-binding protein
MASLKTKFNVGLFLICGITLVIAAIIWLGMSNYLEKGRLFVAYYDESVQGLDVDSPVKYRGVHIGRVHAIGVAPDGKMIEVVLKIESDIKPKNDAQNLVAQLKSVGITGLMFIELEQKQADDPELPALSFKPDYPVINTRPSEISKFFKGIDDIFNLFRALDANTISNQLTAALKKINRTIDDAPVADMVNDFRHTLKAMEQFVSTDKMDQLWSSLAQTSGNVDKMAVNADAGISEIRQTVGRLDHIFNSGGGNVQQITTELKASATQIKQAMETATALLGNTNHQVDAIQRQVSVTLNRIDRAADTLNRLLTQLANQPSQMIFSTPAIDKP